MKKLLFTLAAASVMLVSCKKEEAVEPTKTSEAAKGTIVGNLNAELDLSKDGLEKAPDGTVVTATTVVNGQTFTYEGKVADGAYSISIPVGQTARVYTVRFSSFTADQTQRTGQLPSAIKTYYTAADAEVTLVGGVTKAADKNYNAANAGDVTKGKVTFSATVKCDLDISNASTDENNVPDGVKVVYVTDAGDRYETTVSGGAIKFEIDTKGANSINGTLKFEDFWATQNQPAGSTPSSITKKYTRSDIGAGGQAGFKVVVSTNSDTNGKPYIRYN